MTIVHEKGKLKIVLFSNVFFSQLVYTLNLAFILKFLMGGSSMNTEVMYTWKNKDYKEKTIVKDLVNSFIKGLDSHQSQETFEIQIAQSDRLIDFSILTTVEKTGPHRW